MANTEARPDQIAALTDGHILPLKPLNSEHLKVILEGLAEAWSEMIALGYQSLKSGTEDEVTALLTPKLNNFCQSRKRWTDIIQSASRGSEVVNFDGKKLKKEPDLPLILRLRNANFPLIVECKIIDHPNGKTTKLYCDQGIARFICGDYAWAEQEAIMLGYVRDGSTVPTKLSPHLAKSAKFQPDPFLTAPMPGQRDGFPADIYFTTHGRAFEYLPCCDGTDPGNITLIHLWLSPVS